MNTTTRSAAETKELVWIALQDHDDWVNSSVLAEEVGVSKWTIIEHMKKLKVEHPEIISSKAFGYKITAGRKNSEGYSDPTAMAAINKVDAELAAARGEDNSVSKKEYNHSFYGADYDDILPGTLWETSSSNGNTDFFFVISNMVNGAPVAFGLNVYPRDLDGYPDRKVDVVIDSVVSGVYVGDISCLRSKPMKYFMGEVTIKRPTETLAMAKSAVASLVGMDEVIRDEHKAGYNEGYFKGFDDGKAAGEEEHKEALAEEHQRGLREGTDKGYDKGYLDGKADAEKEHAAKEVPVMEPEEKVGFSDIETVDYADAIQLITERNLYKTFYEQLLEVMKS